MKAWHVLTVVFAAGLILVLALTPGAQEKETALRQALGEQMYLNCGLEKLSEEEEQELVAALNFAPLTVCSDATAAQYLRRQGWREIRIVGAVDKDHYTNDKLLLAIVEYDLYLLDGVIMPYLLEPGVYWAQMTGSSWDVIYPDGQTAHFWVEEAD